ncbi:MAG: hypothetical protein ACE5K8_10710 [Candidatus Zixiibacteriota bacterium]
MSAFDDRLSGKPRIGVYVCHCGVNIGGKVNVTEVVRFVENLPHVVVAREYRFMCSDPGQELIQKDIRELSINRVVVASCSPLMHESTFRQVSAEAGQNQFYFHMANIREHVSWVTADPDRATTKTKALVAAAVRRVALHTALEQKRVSVHPEVLVVGGGISGIHAALTMRKPARKFTWWSVNRRSVVIWRNSTRPFQPWIAPPVSSHLR